MAVSDDTNNLIDFPQSLPRDESTQNTPNGNGNSPDPSNPEDKKRKKLSEGVIETFLTDFLDGEPLPFGGHVPFQANFRVFKKDKISKPAFLEYHYHNQTVEAVSVAYIASVLRNRVRNFTEGKKSELNVDQKACEKIVRAWALITQTCKLADWPKSVGFKSDPGVCFSRHNFDPILTTPEDLKERCPIFWETLNRMTNARAFCLRVGSIFDPQADRKQAIWLYGAGGGGKSFLSDILGMIVGGEHATAEISPSLLRSNHWKEPLIGKTIMIAREAPVSFIANDEFKSLTGDRWHSINPKNEPIYIAELNCFVFLMSNNPPEVPDDDAIKDRLLVCRLEKVSENNIIEDAELLRQLAKDELPYFLGYCIGEYKNYGKKRLPSDSASTAILNDAIAASEIPLQALFDRCFKHVPNAIEVTSSEMFNMVSHYLTPSLTINKFRAFLKTRYGCEIGRLVKVSGKTDRFIIGIKRNYTPLPWE